MKCWLRSWERQLRLWRKLKRATLIYQPEADHSVRLSVYDREIPSTLFEGEALGIGIGT